MAVDTSALALVQEGRTFLGRVTDTSLWACACLPSGATSTRNLGGDILALLATGFAKHPTGLVRKCFPKDTLFLGLSLCEMRTARTITAAFTQGTWLLTTEQVFNDACLPLWVSANMATAPLFHEQQQSVAIFSVYPVIFINELIRLL